MMLCIFHNYEVVFLIDCINFEARSEDFCNVTGLFIFLIEDVLKYDYVYFSQVNGFSFTI